MPLTRTSLGTWKFAGARRRRAHSAPLSGSASTTTGSTAAATSASPRRREPEWISRSGSATSTMVAIICRTRASSTRTMLALPRLDGRSIPEKGDQERAFRLERASSLEPAIHGARMKAPTSEFKSLARPGPRDPNKYRANARHSGASSDPGTQQPRNGSITDRCGTERNRPHLHRQVRF